MVNFKKVSSYFFLLIVMAIGLLWHTIPTQAETYCNPRVAPDKLAIKIFFVEYPAGKLIVPPPAVIPLGARVRFDATAKNTAGNCLDNGSGNVQWSITPSGTIKPMSGNAFEGLYQASSNGTFQVKATLDGLTSNVLSIAVGNALPTTSGINNGGYTEDKYCAYKQDNKTICATGSRDDITCTDTPECVGKTCTRVTLNQCSNNGDKFCAQTPLPNPPAEDLGGLIGKLFNWSIGVLGVAVFGMIFYNGFLLFTAAGNMSQVSKAQEGIKNAALGALLLISSYVILNTINPNFVKQTSALPGLGGTPAPITANGPVQSCSPSVDKGSAGAPCTENSDCNWETSCVNKVCTPNP